SALQRISLENGLAGEVAGLILQIESGESLLRGSGGDLGLSNASPIFGDGILGGDAGVLGSLFSAVTSTKGLLLEAPPRPSARPTPQLNRLESKLPTAEISATKTVVFNLSQMKLRSRGIKSMGDVLAVLGDLEKRGGVTLNREVDVVRRRLAS